jgi:hypothetical protein
MPLTLIPSTLNLCLCQEVSLGALVSFRSFILYRARVISYHTDNFIVCAAGKVLSYHSASDTKEIILVGSSVATPFARNGNWKRRACSSSRLTQMLSITFLSAIILEGLSSFSIDAKNNPLRLQTTAMKITGIADTIILGVQQNMMNADLAAINASTSQIAFWDPFLEDATVSTNIENLISIVSLCSARPTFLFRMVESGSYALQPLEATEPLQMQGRDLSSTRTLSNQQTLPFLNLPMAVFTPNFSQAALELFDHLNQGAFVIIFRDPIDIYLEQYTKAKELSNVADSEVNDNLLVRYLSGINDKNRRVNSGDYDVARQVLMSKFVIGSCDDPAETLRKFVKIFGFSGGRTPRCSTARLKWNEECRKMKEIGQQNKLRSHPETLRSIESDHHFDILLYEDSKIIFRKQNALFGMRKGK